MRSLVKSTVIALQLLVFLLLTGCGTQDTSDIADQAENQVESSREAGAAAYPAERDDGAVQLEVSAGGSLQNPAFAPDGGIVLLTRFRGGYNEGPADLCVFDLEKTSLDVLVSDGSENINLPGSAWNSATGLIVFASSRYPHDEIFLIDPSREDTGPIRLTAREDKVSYEPSFSPDGLWVVFESHDPDVETGSIITRYPAGGAGDYQELTGPSEDCRQPNWSPTGDLIVYQKQAAGRWELWVMAPDGTGKRRITQGEEDETDASFSPDGRMIVYSSGVAGTDYANLFIAPVAGGPAVRLTRFRGYDGAPSWSPDGKRVIFESFPGDPDGSEGSTLFMIDVHETIDID